MEEEKFTDRLKGVSGCVWFLFAGFIIVGLFLIIAGSIVYALNKGTKDGGVGILCVGVGVACEVLFLSIGIIIPFIQWKKGITAESTRVWKSGVLTSKVVYGDVFRHNKSKMIGFFIATGVVALIVILIGILSEEKDFNFLLVAIIPFVTLFFAIKEVINMKKNRAYRIEEDRVVGSEIKTTYDVVDAVTNHMPTKTPALYFDKYGEYPVNSMHIHPYYSPQEIVNEIENGEKVYIVFSKDKDKILHIYRKKFWKLEQK